MHVGGEAHINGKENVNQSGVLVFYEEGRPEVTCRRCRLIRRWANAIWAHQ